MTQIITGPFGRLAYFDSQATTSGQYPDLNLPDTAFAQANRMRAANSSHGPHVISLPRQTRSRAALAMFGAPTKRKS
mgnify:CR=1 FL=1